MSTLTLRPDAAGDETTLSKNGGTYNWEQVDEASQDGDTTYVYSDGATWRRDLYNLPASGGAGTINKITVKEYIAATWIADCYYKISIKPVGGSTVDNAGAEITHTDYQLKSQEWATNPYTSAAWTWDDIDGLQIGVHLRGASWAKCTQVYVEVDYEESHDLIQAVGQGAITITGAVSQTMTMSQLIGLGAVAISGVLSLGLAFVVSVGQAAITIASSVSRTMSMVSSVGLGTIAISGVASASVFFAKAVGQGLVAISGSLSFVKAIALNVGQGLTAIAGSLSSAVAMTLNVGQGLTAIAGSLSSAVAMTLNVGQGAVSIAGSLISYLLNVLRRFRESGKTYRRFVESDAPYREFRESGKQYRSFKEVE